MGAIHGVRFTGFIGKVYTCFPFPQKPENFKQNPAGYQTQAQVRSIIKDYAETIEIPFVVDSNALEVAIGDYKFSRSVFHGLIRYVWRGGYPRWENEIRPSYVLEMKSKLKHSRSTILKNLALDNKSSAG
jgi:hypothetical protein